MTYILLDLLFSDSRTMTYIQFAPLFIDNRKMTYILLDLLFTDSRTMTYILFDPLFIDNSKKDLHSV